MKISVHAGRMLSHIIVYRNYVVEICSATYAPRANIVRALSPRLYPDKHELLFPRSNIRAHLLNEQYRVRSRNSRMTQL
jgi:hypothetical protein